MRWCWIFVLLIVQVNFIYAGCSDGQVDINSASASELEEIYMIGPVKAEAIINTRPFESVDDLVEVYGIGEKTLEAIKNQGLACVEDRENSKEGEKEDEESGEKSYDERVEAEKILPTAKIVGEKKPEVIKLGSGTKDIKTEDSGESNNKYPYYGLAAFAVLLGFLFLINRKKYKTEFDDG